MQRRHGILLLAACALLLALSWWRSASVHSRATRGVAADARPPGKRSGAFDPGSPAAVRRPPAVAPGTGAGDARAVRQCALDYDRAIAAHLEALSSAADARTQLARSLLLPVEEAARPSSDAALARATALAPTDPVVAWVAHVRCGAGCDRAAAAARLAAIDSGNAAAWLAQLELAHEGEDATSIDRALARAARAPRYQDHFGEAAAAMAAVLAQVPWPASCGTSAIALGRAWGLQRPGTRLDAIVSRATALSAARVVPMHVGLSRTCAAQALALSPEREADCLAVLARMAGSDTALVRLQALTRLAATTARADGPHWRDQLRQLDYLLWQGQRLEPDPASVAVGWEVGEITAMQARLRALHRWPPPKAWLPRDPRTRGLVTAGRPTVVP